jgi:hypothetical protein
MVIKGSNMSDFRCEQPAKQSKASDLATKTNMKDVKLKSLVNPNLGCNNGSGQVI